MDVGDVRGNILMWTGTVGVTAAIDVWEVGLNAGGYARVGGVSLAQSSDLGDAAMEILLFKLLWGNTTSGSGGTTTTDFYTGATLGSSPVNTKEGGNTTAASGGTEMLTSAIHGWNVLQPLDLWYPNGLEPILLPPDASSELNVVRLLAAPADSLTMTSALFLRGNAFA